MSNSNMHNFSNVALENISPPPTPSPPYTSSPLQIEYNCKSCSHPDNSHMVQCDECDEWHHYQCVNVTDAIQHLPWFCPKCVAQMYHPPTAISSPPCSSKQTIPTTTASSISNLPTASRIPPNAVSTKKVNYKETDKVENPTSENANLIIKLKMLEEERILKEKRDNEYLCKKYELLRVMALSSQDNLGMPQTADSLTKAQAPMLAVPDDEVAGTNKVKSNGSTTGLEATAKGQSKQTSKSSGIISNFIQPNMWCYSRPESSSLAKTVLSQPVDKTINVMHPEKSNLAYTASSAASTTAFQNVTSAFGFNPVLSSSTQQNVDNSPQIQQVPLNNQQLVARIALQKELPIFSGNVEDWPLFINSFDNSTRSCGFTDDENLLRLQRCLKGDALAAVKARLLYPSQVSNVIKTLKMLYGRPEAIVITMMDKIRREPPPKAEKIESLVPFALSVQNLTATIESNGLNFYLESPCLLQELVDKLPAQIRLNWGLFKLNTGDVNLSSFSQWLVQVAEAACEVSIVSPHRANNGKAAHQRPSTGKTYVHEETFETGERKQRSCLCCQGKCIALEHCYKFKIMDLNDKWALIKRHSICRTCLRTHRNRKCQVDTRCNINGCSYRHHKLLHKNYELSDLQQTSNQSNQNLQSPNVNINFHQKSGELLFKIIPITVFNKEIKIYTFALLDDGSNVTLMDEGLAKKLKLKGEVKPLCLKWTSSKHRLEQNSMEVNIHVANLTNHKKHLLSRVHTVQALTLPSQTLDFDMIQSRFPYLRGLPIHSYENARPQILIGLDNCKLTNAQKMREADEDQPFAIKTRLGWTVFGRCGPLTTTNKTNYIYHVCECKATDDAKLDQLMRGFNRIESIGSKIIKQMMSADEMEAERLIKEHTKRIGDRFSVPLLLKGNIEKLPKSRPAAIQRLICLERKLRRDSALRVNMHKQIESYLSKGYARKLNPSETRDDVSRKVWYLPIFPVVNPNKPSKVRIVWDAAAEVEGISLNSLLLTGSDEVPLLPSVLFKFRQFKVAVCGDIKEMFHQVKVRENDQHLQRFLWRNESTGEIEDYVMQVMTFGSTCSPYCAQFVKNTNAKDFMLRFPRAAKAILENHYVDDYLDSFETEKEAIEVTKRVKYIHERAGFQLRNFISNSLEVSKDLGSERENKPHDKALSHILLGYSEKVLGLWWTPNHDCFSYSYAGRKLEDSIRSKLPPTKRFVLKILMSFFDPLGLLAHILVSLKILLQEIWRTNITWDEEIQEEHFEKWKKWSEQLKRIREIKIKRCYLERLRFDSTHQVQLHVFVDASASACAAVAYFRVTKSSRTECVLVCAKTKVAPLKPISIPRMELEAAILGVRMARMITDGHSIVINERFFWSDSQTVLCWIKNGKRKLKQYVAFRIGEILEESSPSEWKWVPTKDNVADDGTRWNVDVDITSESRWFRGPSFLYLAELRWPQQTINFTTQEEVVMLIQNATCAEPIIDFSHFTSWIKLKRSIALVFSFIDIMKRRKVKGTARTLVVQDLLRAENFLYSLCQREVFPKEWCLLQNLKSKCQNPGSLEKSSPLYKLNPYLDQNGIIRIKGRIDACAYATPDCKRPIILPKNHKVTLLVIQHFHEKFYHQFHETVVNDIRQKYHISGLRNVLKKVIRSCCVCRIRNAKPNPPLMGELPVSRMSPFSRPFSFVGLDYFGPMIVTVGRRAEKRWGVLFTCLTVRAIHIEIAHSLTADSCILALKRFCSRRGIPLEVWSDNGTNFRGADQELRNAVAAIDVNAINEECVQRNIVWKFIPPQSPHMGGSWERLVRSVKQALASMKNSNRTVKDELLISMMTEVEYIINSRPLTYVPVDVDSEEALTPNHFLLGSSNGAKVFGELNGDGKVLKRNWLICEEFGNIFWKRWLREYLPVLVRRTKWFQPVKPIAEGDLVIIVSDENPRGLWPKGRVIRVNTGGDGQVRSAVVQTKSGIYTRPTTKLAVLEIERKDEYSETRFTGGGVTERGNINHHF